MKLLALLLSTFVILHSSFSAPPNIVIMLVDDMGVMDTSVPFLTDADGKAKRYPLNDFYRTPNMERLATRGIRFNNFCAMSVCSPTRISIMTGQNAARHRTTNWISPDKDNAGPNGPPQWNWRGLKKGDVTLASLLQSSGYRTIHVGKGHFGPRDSDGAEPMNLGFDINVAGCSIGAPGSYYGLKNFGGIPENAGGKKKQQQVKKPGSAVPGLEKYHGQEIFLTEALTIEAKSHVADAVKAQKPFFLYFPQYAVHGPHQSDPRYAENYANSGKPQQAQNFATLVEGMDKSLGDVLDHLDALGVADNTLVFFLGDNGSDAPLGHQHEVACAAPLRGKKGSHYEGGTRVPFIVRWPGVTKAGSVCDVPTIHVDIFPTFLELTRGDAPKQPLDGESLVKLFRDPAAKLQRDAIYQHFPGYLGAGANGWRTTPVGVIQSGDWKLIEFYEDGRLELYNLRSDISEQKNLAGEQPGKAKELHTKLVAWRKEVGAKMPTPHKAGEQPPGTTSRRRPANAE